VRFVGEKVAAVAAIDPDIAEEALILIDVEYEELPAVFDPIETMEPGAPVIHEGSPSYDSPTGQVTPDGNVIYHNSWSGSLNTLSLLLGSTKVIWRRIAA